MGMNFFPAELYRLQESDHFPAILWQERFDQYQLHLDDIRSQLTSSLRVFSNHYFHDCEICRTLLLPKGIVQIELRGTKTNRKTGRKTPGIHTLFLTGAEKLSLNALVIGQRWLWEELHISSRGMFRLTVLTDADMRSFSITFKNLRVKTVKQD